MMSPLLAPLAALLLAAAAPAGPPLVFRGNEALTDEVYLAYLDLPPNLPADEENAVSIRARLLDFLHRAGYELARVETAAEDGHIQVDIDEGRVAKLVLIGASSWRTAQLLMTLALPFNVYNRPYLERQLALVHEKTGLEAESVEVVQVEPVDHSGPQLHRLGGVVDELGRYIGHPLIPPASPYEVHVRFKHREWRPGLGLTAGLGGSEGFRLGVDYRGGNLLWHGDRWITDARVGLKLRNRLDDGSAYPALQTASVMGGWATPPIVSGLRPMLSLRLDTTSGQRADLDLESYRIARSQLGAALTYELGPGAHVAIGGGLEYRSIFGLEPVDSLTLPADIEARTDLLPYASADLAVVFDPDNARLDRHHELVFTNRHYPHNGQGFGTTILRYQRYFEFGWHDVRVRARGAWIWGDPSFVDEEQVGGVHVRAVFDSRFFTRRAASVGAEYRFSITRDVNKIGFFTDAAVFADPNRVSGTERSRVVGSFGPSFHALVADAFQLDLYYAIGLASRTDIERGLTVSINQAF